MNFVARNWSRSDLFYLGFLLTLVILYGAYLFSFTLFDGFATLSSDSFSYILLARKWSPYFLPSTAEILTWPGHTYPPGFAWLLAVTGASESTYAGHLVVSILMLLSISLIGWLAYRELGWGFGALLTFGLCLLPGAIFSSMSILSENLFLVLSLAALLLYWYICNKDKCSPGWYIALFLCMSLALLTRTVGISLVAALIVAATFDRDLAQSRKRIFLFIALISLGVWQLWYLFDPQSKESSYLSFLSPMLGNENMAAFDRLMYFIGFMRTNLFSMLSAWANYLSAAVSNIYVFLFSYLLLIICFISTVLRALRLNLDAIYILFSLGILLVWPYPAEMLRFLHPLIMLFLVQPVFFFYPKAKSSAHPYLRPLIFSIVLLFIFNSLVAQRNFVELRNEARNIYPTIVHSREYYGIPNKNEAIRKSLIFQNTILLMASATDVVPEGIRVASDQHTAFTLLADRAAVNLTSIVPFHQQLCNFKVVNVDFVFLSALTNAYNPLGIKLFESYEEIASYVWSIKDEDGTASAYLLQLDREEIDERLSASGFKCQRFQDRPPS